MPTKYASNGKPIRAERKLKGWTFFGRNEIVYTLTFSTKALRQQLRRDIRADGEYGELDVPLTAHVKYQVR